MSGSKTKIATRPGLDEMTADETAEMEAMRAADGQSLENDGAGAQNQAGIPDPGADGADGADTSGADGAADDGDAEEVSPKRPGLVPQKALHSERERRKAAEKAAQELRAQHAADKARADERFAMLQKLVEEATRPPPAAAPAPIEIPDFDADPKGYIQKSFAAMRQEVEQSTGLARQIAESNLRQAEAQQRAMQEQQAMAALQNWGTTQERELEAADPTFPQAREHLLKHRDAELQALGMTDPAQRHAIIRNDALQLAAQCYQSGRNFAETIREIARARGFTPQQAAQSAAPNALGSQTTQAVPPVDIPSRVAAAERGRDMSLSLGAGGGAPRGQLTADKMASMSDAEFATTLAKLKSDPAAMRALFGA